MAPLKFRNEPLSFPLTRPFKNYIADTRDVDSTLVLFGYRVVITSTKKKEFLASHHRLAKFETFLDKFDSWLSTFKSTELSTARSTDSDFDKLGFNYSRRGVYDENGGFLGSLDDFARDNGLQVATLPSRQYARSFVTSRAEQTHFQSNAAMRSKDKYTYVHPGHEEAMRKSRQAFSDSHATASGGEATRSGKRSESFDSTHQTAMTATQGKKIANAAKDLEARRVNYRSYATFNLGDKQRPLSFEEEHVPVRRGDYSGVNRRIIAGKNRGFVITGPTGCGKSTVALLPLFIYLRLRVMIVEPTQANAANIFHEFANILPNLFTSGVIGWAVPKVQFVAPTVMKPPFTPLQVTTTDKLLEYFEYHGKLPDVDFIVIDEFHLPIQSMVQTVELIRTFDFGMKYIFVSATAEGYAVNPQLPRAVTQIYGQLPLGQIPSKIEGSDLDPRRWFSRGDGTVGIVAPSVVLAQRLSHVYKGWSLRVYLITRHTTVTEYMKAVTNYKPRTVYVLEPGVEAGVTLSISVLISMGAATAIRYDGKVVVEDTQPLDPIAAIQRGGRGGRVVPTLYVTPRVPDGSVPVSSSGYYRAQAVVKLIAAGADVTKIKDRGLFRSFPRLRTVSRTLAIAAVEAGGDPFVALYQRADDGRVYKECGGTGEDFEKLAASELFLYHYTGGFFVAPIADFSDLESRPDTFVERQSQLSAAHQIARSVQGLEDSYSLDDLVALLISKFDVYVNDLFSRLALVFSEPKPMMFGIGSKDRAPDVKDFLTDAPEITKLFEYMVSQPAGIVYERKEKFSDGVKQSSHSFIFRDKSLHFAFPSKFMNGRTVNVKLLCSEVYDLLRGLLAIEMLIDGAPEKCVDLETYVGRIPREHVWFNTNVGRHGRNLNSN